MTAARPGSAQTVVLTSLTVGNSRAAGRLIRFSIPHSFGAGTITVDRSRGPCPIPSGCNLPSNVTGGIFVGGPGPAGVIVVSFAPPVPASVVLNNISDDVCYSSRRRIRRPASWRRSCCGPSSASVPRTSLRRSRTPVAARPVAGRTADPRTARAEDNRTSAPRRERPRALQRGIVRCHHLARELPVVFEEGLLGGVEIGRLRLRCR